MLLIRFTRNNSLTSKVICLATWSDFSHVEFILPDGRFLGALINGGVQIRPADYAPQDTYQRAYIECDSPTAARVLAFAEKQVGLPYNLTAILGLGFHRDWAQPSHWFCSELIAASCDSDSLELLDRIPDYRITPQMLWMSPEVILDGPIIYPAYA